MTNRTRTITGGAVGLGVLATALVVGTLRSPTTRIDHSPRAAAVESCACPCVEPQWTFRDFVLLMTGPGRCGAVWPDLDRDGDTDLVDFAYLQNGAK